MRKYLVIFQQTFSQYISYRLNILLNLLSGFITPGLMLLALKFARSDSLISVSSLLPYYLIISFINPITITTVDQEMDELAEKGDLYQFLTRPLSLYRWLLTKNFSEKLAPVFFVLPILFILLFIIPQSNFHFSFLNLFISLIALILAFILSFNISYLIGLFCFWLDEFWAMSNLKFVIISFLSGSVLPYTFFPNWLSHFLSYTPFPYLASWFPRVLSGHTSPLDYLYLVSWIFVSYLLLRFLEARAIRHYSYVGG